ncbi:cell division protein FtsL [Pseudopelagicola sp. nBUS_20]|uniref:cell division protein FtsL n=1 Tax=Pseudopelagicola sp. nBUS_20 TaxID=3395317 RepID=UPI003EC04657
MRTILLVLTAMAVIGLAVWAYQENYRTQHATVETERLQRQIGEARSRLAMLKAEWAYLNRPERLRDLAEINYYDLQLLPLRPEQFGNIDQVAYPPTGLVFDLSDAVDVSSQGDWP